MALGDVTPKKLFQGYLSGTPRALYTVPSGKRGQVIDIWVDNQKVENPRYLSLYVSGLALSNRISHNIKISADSSMVISSNKIILNNNEVFGMSQDTGTDVLITIYGIEEDII